MTWPEVLDLFDYWRQSPPIHELIAGYVGYEPPKTIEEQIADGAMSPADFFRHVKRTGGKVEGISPGA